MDWKEKNVGSITRKGSTNRTFVRAEDTGRYAGFQEEHWDGRQDATVLPETIHVKVKVQSEGGNDE